ncbi:hypothetical protein D1007_19488 [Hordeum vulgare]|nr:hypothetical protein D1007_19488 [Hordeum vulgare]
MSPSKPPPAASSSGDLPADALYEVLLRIPAKELCRLRAVCPAWCALTSDRHFVAAHKSRHRTSPPLLAMGYRDDSGVSGVAISDLSGNVVKRIPSTGYEIVTAFSVLNPATGAIIDLPTGRSDELELELEVGGIDKWRCHFESCAFGPRRSASVAFLTGCIASFNLETEDWMDVLRGPEPVYKYVQEHEVYGYAELELQLSLAELSGSLVMSQDKDFWKSAEFIEYLSLMK